MSATKIRTKANGLETETVSPQPEITTAEQERARAERAHRAALQRFPKVVEDLVNLLGAPLVAYLTNVTETRAVRQWIAGERVPHPSTQTKLQLALQVAKYLEDEGEDGAIEAWFQGLNPSLSDHAPAELIRATERMELPSIGRQILAAAKEFANS